MTAQLLQRVSVSWYPEPAYEDTDTVALNVNGYYLDLRITKEDNTLQWSRAGERIIAKHDPFSYRWTCIIDSTGTLSSDEATWDWEKLGNGDVFEAGTANCPHKNGAPTKYEEIWREVRRAGPAKMSWILQSVDGSMFLGYVGGTFLAMRSTIEEGYSVKRSEWNSQGRTWETKYEAGAIEGLPHVEVVLEAIEKREGRLDVDGIVSIAGVDFVIRGREALGAR